MTNARSNRRRPGALAAVAGAALTLVLAACIPPAPPTTTTTSTTSTTSTTTTSSTVPQCVPEPATVSQGDVTLTVSQATCLEVGDEVTVTGSGYNTTGNLGTRPPLLGLPAGVYVQFGEYADVWKYSEIKDGAARKPISQVWALPSPSFEIMGGSAAYAKIAPDGTFELTLTIGAPLDANPNLGFVTYAAGGAVNAAEELFVPASWLG
jgi:hypothetical protein